MKETKYKDYQIGSNFYTVKLTYLPTGGVLHYNPTVKVDIMELHTKPITFLDKLLEHSKFSIETYEWDPLLTDLSLDDYIKKHSKITKINKAIKKANDEWDSFEGE